jgi:hypothetical protein
VPRPSLRSTDEQQKRVKSLRTVGLGHDDLCLRLPSIAQAMAHARSAGGLEGDGMWDSYEGDMFLDVSEMRRNDPYPKELRNSRSRQTLVLRS